MRELIDLARNSASAVNSQALKFKLINAPPENEKVFETLSWAGLLKDWDGPEKGERPPAYIIILCDLSISSDRRFDEGIAAQSILLGAVEKGLGGCMLGSIDKKRLAENLNIDVKRYSIDLVLAVGKPKETVKITALPENGDTSYYRDENGVHYVPKRGLDDIII